MDPMTWIEETTNILAQYRSDHLTWMHACLELADLGLPLQAIIELIQYEDETR